MRKGYPAVALAAVMGLVGCASIYGIGELPGEDASDAPVTHHPEGGTSDAAHHDATADGPGHHDAGHDAGSEGKSPADAPRGDAPLEAGVGDGTAPLDAPDDVKLDVQNDAHGDAGSATFTLSPSILTVAPGASANLTVNLASALATSVTVAATGLPSGVTAPSTMIAAGSTQGTLMVSASATATPQVVTTTGVDVSGVTSPFALVVSGVSGSADSTFNQHGVLNLTPPDGGANGTVTSIATMSDGSIIAVGSANNTSGGGWGVVKVGVDGTPDDTFNANVVDPTKGATMPSGDIGGVAVTSSGLIVVSGVDTPNQSVAVAVLNPDGTRDEAFGTNGMAERGPDNDFFVTGASAPAVDAQGDIAVAGIRTVSSNPVGYLLVYPAMNSTTPEIYQSFGSGIAPSCVGYDPSGNIIVGGSDPGTGGKFYLTRFSTVSGGPEANFAGLIGPPDGGANPFLTGVALAIDPSGGTFLVGNSDVANPASAMTYVDATGTTSIANGWKNPGPSAMDDVGYLSVASNQTGIAVVVADGYAMSGSQVILARITSAGALDTTFASGVGYIRTNGLMNGAMYEAVTYDPWGRIVVGGNAANGFYILRFWP